MVVPSTDFTNLDHLAFWGGLCSSEWRGVFAEREMSAPLMVIGNVRSESTMQRALAEDDDVIQTLAANRSNEPFNVGPMPRRARSR